MDQLWAPWRLAYVTTAKTPSPADECFICRGLGEQNDRQNLIAQRGALSVTILNRFPYNNGHLLVAPQRHVGELHQLTDAEHLELMQTTQKLIQVLRELMQPDGFNIGLNLGKVAGAGLPGHLHWHIVPRWAGDTNFMSVLGDVKVIVQALDALWEMLTPKLARG